jgi:G protein-coupled receptor GPR1
MVVVLHPGQLDQHEEKMLQIVTISSCSLSMLAVSGVIIWWICRTNTERKFRHQLLMILLVFDFFKAIFCAVYSIRFFGASSKLLTKHTSFCNGLGFLTAMAIEGADFSVLLIAGHTATLILSKKSAVKKPQLVRYRKFIFVVLFIVLPCLLAGVGLIGDRYAHDVTKCYLGFTPMWYRLALSWIPRGVIMVGICVIYVMIYIYVRAQMRRLDKEASLVSPERQITGLTLSGDQTEGVHSSSVSAPFVARTRHVINYSKAWLSQFPGLAHVSPYDWNMPNKTTGITMPASGNETRHTTLVAAENVASCAPYPTQLQSFFNSENYNRFRQQRLRIEYQLNFMFIYPIAYVIVWMFPLAQECMIYRFKRYRPGHLWVTAVSQWMIPFSGFVDAVLFFFKERFRRQLPMSHSLSVPNTTEAGFIGSTAMESDMGPPWSPLSRNSYFSGNSPFQFGSWSKSKSKKIGSIPSLRSPTLVSPTDRRKSDAETLGVNDDDEMSLTEFLHKGPGPKENRGTWSGQ